MRSSVSGHRVPAFNRCHAWRLLEGRQQDLPIHVPARGQAEERQDGWAKVEQAGAEKLLARAQRRAVETKNAEVPVLDSRAGGFGRDVLDNAGQRAVEPANFGNQQRVVHLAAARAGKVHAPACRVELHVLEVDDLDAALEGKQVLVPPGSPSAGVRAALIGACAVFAVLAISFGLGDLLAPDELQPAGSPVPGGRPRRA